MPSGLTICSSSANSARLVGEVLDDALDDEVAVGQPAEVVGGVEAGDDRVALVGRQLLLGHLAVEAAGDGGQHGVGAGAAPGADDDLVAGPGRDLGQPGAHDPRPDDAHPG